MRGPGADATVGGVTTEPARVNGAVDGVRELLLVRHGESVGNVAATAAEQLGVEEIDVDTRDADTPLSPTG